MPYILFILWLIFSCQVANAGVFEHKVLPGDIAAVESAIPKPDILKTDFTQTKKIQGLEKDLNSAGRLIYARKYGVFWDISSPFAITYIFTAKGLKQIEDGKTSLVPASSNAFFHEFSNFLQAIFSGEYQTLAKHFDVYFMQRGKKWELGLRPVNRVVRGVISEITVSGENSITGIMFKENNGDSTKIYLKNNRQQQLTQDEENYFNF